MRWVSEKNTLIYLVLDEQTKKILDYAYNEPAALESGSKHALAFKISVRVVKFKSVGSVTF